MPLSGIDPGFTHDTQGDTQVAVVDGGGTGNVASVKAASTSAATTDPSLVVAVSPNTSLPSGTNTLGAVTQASGPWTENLTEIAGSAVSTAATGVQKVGAVGSTGTALDSAAGTPNAQAITVQGNSSGVPVPVSGTVTANQGTPASIANSWTTEITDGTHGPVAVKAASTAAAATDPSLVVALSPNTPLPSGTNTLGIVNQGTGAVLSDKWAVQVTDGTNTMPTMDVVSRAGFQKLTDGTNGPVAVKAASTAAVATDPSLVAALSPNTPLPAGTNTLGTVHSETQDGSGNNITSTAINSKQRLDVNLPSEGTAGSAVPFYTQQVGGSDGTDLRALHTDSFGNQYTNLQDGSANKITSAANSNATPNQMLHVQKPNTTVASTVLGASGASISISIAGLETVAFQIAAGTLIGTLTPQVSMDGGTTWYNSFFYNYSTNIISSTLIFSAANTAATLGINIYPGATNARVEVSAYTSGTANAIMNASATLNHNTVVNIPVDGRKSTYSAAVVALATATTATDIFTITGSASKTIRVMRIEVTYTQSAANMRDILLVSRSSANSGGTSTAETAVPHDSTNPAATASVLSYTANPTTLGTTVGTLRATKSWAATGTGGSSALTNILVWDFGARPSQAIVLRGTSQVLAVNLDSTTVSTPNFDISIEWTEE